MDIQSFDFRKIQGYLKIRFRDLPLGKKPEISLFFWEGGESLPHNHKKTRELTYVAAGTIKEERLVDGKLVEKFYTEGDLFEVPEGTEHIVKAMGIAVTLNFCEEELEMDVLPDFRKTAA